MNPPKTKDLDLTKSKNNSSSKHDKDGGKSLTTTDKSTVKADNKTKRPRGSHTSGAEGNVSTHTEQQEMAGKVTEGKEIPKDRQNNSTSNGAGKESTSSELLQFGSMISDSIKSLTDTMSHNSSQLQQSLEASRYTEAEYEYSDNEYDDSRSDNESEPPRKRKKGSVEDLTTQTATDCSTSNENGGDNDVLTGIAEKLNIVEKVDSEINVKLAKMVNSLMFKTEKPDEGMIKERIGKIQRPGNCESLVTTRVDELIWQRPRPQTRSFDSKAQTAQTCIVKSVTILAKMLNSTLNIIQKLSDVTEKADASTVLKKDLDLLVQDGMYAIETMSFANYEVNARRRECIKPDLNDDYTSLFSASVPINQFLFGGDTSKRLEDIDKTNKVVRKAMVQGSYPRQRYNNSRNTTYSGRGRTQKFQRHNQSQRPFLGKRSHFASGFHTRKNQRGRGREQKNV
jgi:hypothetical protein